MAFDLASGILFNLEMAQRRPNYNSIRNKDPNARRALDIYEKVYSLNVDTPLAAIWGPPGTGKTTTYIAFFTHIYLQGRIHYNDFIHYVAPSNDLVVDTGSRLAAMLLAERMMGSPKVGLKDFIEVVESMRLYGSKIYSGSKRSVKEFVDRYIDCGGSAASTSKCYDEVVKALKKATVSHPDKNTKFLLTTEFQDVIRRYGSYIEVLTGSPRKELHMFADEASKAPYYAPFRTVETLIRYIISGKLEAGQGLPKSLQNIDLVSLVVIGDHRQAIALEPEFHARRDLLLLLAVAGTLRRRRVCSSSWSGEQCAMLEYTKRLPEPSHEPISKAYYHGSLKSLKTPRDALEPVSVLAEGLERVRARLEKTSPRKAMLVKAVADAISSRIPVVVINVKSRFQPGSTFEPARVAAAYTIAQAIAEAARTSGVSGLDIAVSSIYSEMLEPFCTLKGVRPSTVQAMLGGEADIHVTMLGKEWYGSTPCIRPWQAARDDRDDKVTLYYREPELFNVQLSRHSRLLVLVGNIDKFKGEAGKALKQANQEGCSKDQLDSLKALITALELIDEASRKGDFVRVNVDV